MDFVAISSVIVFLLLGVGMIAFRRWRLRQIMLRGEFVEGLVVASRTDAETNLWELTVRFVPLGSDETFEIQDYISIRSFEAAPKPGSKIRVVYDRGDPTYARLMVSAM